MTISITNSDYYDYYHERAQSSHISSWKVAVLFFVILAMLISMVVLHQWWAAGIVLIEAVALFIVDRSAPRLKAISGIRKNMFFGQMTIEVVKEELILQKDKSTLRLSYSDFKFIDEGSVFFHFEHSIGFVFFLPKPKMTEAEVALLSSLAKKIGTLAGPKPR